MGGRRCGGGVKGVSSNFTSPPLVIPNPLQPHHPFPPPISFSPLTSSASRHACISVLADAFSLSRTPLYFKVSWRADVNSFSVAVEEESMVMGRGSREEFEWGEVWREWGAGRARVGVERSEIVR